MCDKDYIFNILDDHFSNEMMMDCIKRKDERHYSDKYFYMIFIHSDNILRILMRNHNGNLFSKNFKMDDINVQINYNGASDSKKSMIDFIKRAVYINSGDQSKMMLTEWYLIKKVELRDKKISDLGI